MTDSNGQGSRALPRGVNDDASPTAFDTVAHDDAWVAVDKPAGLPSVPGRRPELADCAWSRLRQRWPDALVVHRLDMATSGLLLFARGVAVQRTLSRAFAARMVRKIYVAVVHDRVAAEEGTVALPLAADWPRRPRQVVDPDRGKPSLTRWRVIERRPGSTVLELEPLTGRTHQLRVHLAAIGHPVVGDTLYGPTGSDEREPRMKLHALSIELAHPITGHHITLRTKEPSWMHAAA